MVQYVFVTNLSNNRQIYQNYIGLNRILVPNTKDCILVKNRPNRNIEFDLAQNLFQK